MSVNQNAEEPSTLAGTGSGLRLSSALLESSWLLVEEEEEEEEEEPL